MAEQNDSTYLTASYYASPSMTIYAVISTRDATLVGCGSTPREAYDASDETARQSVDADHVETAALQWALREDREEFAALVAIGVADDDLDDRARAWL